jgi:hypothetical protein
LSSCGDGDARPKTSALGWKSPDIPTGTIDNKFVLNGFGCTGGNVSPAVRWRNPPAGTKSYSLQMYDPDAPTGSDIFTLFALGGGPGGDGGDPEQRHAGLARLRPQQRDRQQLLGKASFTATFGR